MPRSFVEVVKDGNFKHVAQQFQGRNAQFWEPGLGDAVRGDLVLFTMGSPLYSEPEVLRNMVRRDDRLQFATAYELAVYAASAGWNGRRRVMALGSKYAHGGVPAIGIAAGDRRHVLAVDTAEHGYWENDRSILCVRV